MIRSITNRLTAILPAIFTLLVTNHGYCQANNPLETIRAEKFDDKSSSIKLEACYKAARTSALSMMEISSFTGIMILTAGLRRSAHRWPPGAAVRLKSGSIARPDHWPGFAILRIRGVGRIGTLLTAMWTARFRA
jgi:hypothetical protein